MIKIIFCYESDGMQLHQDCWGKIKSMKCVIFLQPRSVSKNSTKIHYLFVSVQSIQTEMKSKPTGFDPEHVFMNGSLNVTSAFCLNEFYDFGDPEQVKAGYLTLRVAYRSIQSLNPC